MIINSNETYIEHYGSDAFKYLLNGPMRYISQYLDFVSKDETEGKKGG